MEKCFWKKVLSVVFGVSLVSFLAAGLSAIIDLIIVDDNINEDIEPVKELVESNATIFIVLAVLLVAMILLAFIKARNIRIIFQSIVLVISIAVVIAGIIEVWDYRTTIMNDVYESFYTKGYTKWLVYFSEIMNIAFFACTSFVSLYVSGFLNCKKNEK